MKKIFSLILTVVMALSMATVVFAEAEKEFNTDINKSEIVDIASNSKYPILLTAGSNEDFEEIFATVKSRNPKDTEIVILPECDHANGMYRQTAMYQNSIIEFVNKYLGK